MISYTAAVLVTGHFDLMTRFYGNVLEQRVKYDFGGCIHLRAALASGGCRRATLYQGH